MYINLLQSIYLLGQFLSMSLLFSCTSNSQDQISSSDTLNKNQIKKNGSDKDSSKYGSYSNMIKWLDIDDLRNGYKDEQIRIWTGFALSDSDRVVILKKQNDTWIGAIYYYKYHFNKELGIDSLGKQTVQGRLASGWNNFMNNITGLGIYKLKKYDSIPGYHLCNDGDMLTIEVAKGNQYDKSEYPCYSVYDDSLDDVIKVQKIIETIENEFAFRVSKHPYR